MRILTVLLVSLLPSFPVFAWNNVGHEVIAQLAYNQLSATEKQKIDIILKTQFNNKNPNSRFLSAAVWPDEIKDDPQYHYANAWHYIYLPLKIVDGKPQAMQASSQDAQPNVVSAIQDIETRLQDKSLPRKMQAMYLSFLIHLVGDIHQPLNCATLISKQHHFMVPAGDKGGRNYTIQTAIANNLHTYWNAGLGLLYPSNNNYFNDDKIIQLVNSWAQETRNDLSIWKAIKNHPKPSQWAQESYQLGVQYAYAIPYGDKPTKQYISTGHQIVRKQIILAGNRLAFILQHLSILKG